MEEKKKRNEGEGYHFVLMNTLWPEVLIIHVINLKTASYPLVFGAT